MSTTPITCPTCGVYVRVAVQPSLITQGQSSRPKAHGYLNVEFHPQVVAHTCKPKGS